MEIELGITALQLSLEEAMDLSKDRLLIDGRLSIPRRTVSLWSEIRSNNPPFTDPPVKTSNIS
jgi:hypothetical protein